MKLPFLSSRPSITAPRARPSAPAPAAAPRPSAPRALSSFKPAPLLSSPQDAGRLAVARAFLLQQASPLAAEQRRLTQLAAHLPPGPDRDALREQVAAMRTAAKQKLMTDLETVAVQALPKEQKAQYLALTQELKGADEPVARLALQTMLIEGKLDPKVLAELHALQQQDVAPGIDKHELLADLVNELADPSNVEQGRHSTCAAVSTSLILLKESPAEYVRMVAGLASPEGRVVLESGAVLRRLDVSSRDDRSAVQQLVAPAMMAAAAPPGITFDATRGYFTDGEGKPVNEKGEVVSADHALRRLPAEWVERLMNRALDGRYETYDVGAIANDNEQAAAMAVIASVARREPVSVSVEGEAFGAEGLHRVVVTGISADKKNVTYLDPNGAERTMPVEKFMQTIRRFSTESLTATERKTWEGRHGNFFEQALHIFQRPAELVAGIIENMTGADDDGGRTTKPGGGTNG